jgi:hypothetical protein
MGFDTDVSLYAGFPGALSLVDGMATRYSTDLHNPRRIF